MMVFIKNFDAPKLNMAEILRYAQCSKKTQQIKKLFSECIKEANDVFSYSVCYMETEICVNEDGVEFPFAKIKSRALAKNLKNCEKAVVFAATVGIGIDRLISKYARISPAKAVAFQAIGAERIESLCDVFNKWLKEKCAKEGFFLRPRFSPGYGDFSIEAQKELFKVLDCSRKLGLSLNDSLLMSPSKSVTAVIGFSKENAKCENGCAACNKKKCDFRSSKL